MKRTLFLVSFIFSSVTSSADINSCPPLFYTQETTNIIHSLAELRMKLDLAIAGNSETIAQVAFDKVYQDKENEAVNRTNLSRDRLTSAIKREIESIQKSKDRDSQIEKDHKINIVNQEEPGNVAEFRFIEGGFLPMLPEGNHVDDYYLMSTPVTQNMWQTVAELAKSRLEWIEEINPDPSLNKDPLNPVENVSGINVERWIAALNELSKVGELHLNKIIPDHQAGDKYGLPSWNEFAFPILLASTKLKIEPGEIDSYAWVFANSGLNTHPVGTRLPLELESGKFYDLFGNVFQMTRSFSGYRRLFGSSFESESMDLKEILSYEKLMVNLGQNTGFRLIRNKRSSK